MTGVPRTEGGGLDLLAVVGVAVAIHLILHMGKECDDVSIFVSV